MTAAQTFVSIPGWYQFCLGLQLASSRVSLAVNGLISSRNLSISILNSRNSSLASSTITANNQMFGYLNIHSQVIDQVKIFYLEECADILPFYLTMSGDFPSLVLLYYIFLHNSVLLIWYSDKFPCSNWMLIKKNLCVDGTGLGLTDAVRFSGL